MKNTKKMWGLQASFPFDVYGLSMDAAVEEWFGPTSGRDFGFGGRDYWWNNLTAEEARIMASKLKSFDAAVSVRVCDHNDESLEVFSA